jgi:hypothetical protein
MSKQIEWWAYMHTNGTIQVKRYISELDMEEAMESPFVADVFGPFEAETRNVASVIASDHFDSMLIEAQGYLDELYEDE